MKNWLPFVFGPALAIERMPSELCLSCGWISAAGACGIAALNHEAIDDAMEDDAVVKVLFGQLDEIRHRVGGLLIEEFDGEIPHRRFKTGVSAGLHCSIVAFLM